MRLPSKQRIIDRALDQRGDALLQHDSIARRQIDTLIGNMYSGARLAWSQDGSLRVASVNTPGAVYTTTDRSCTCLARGLCWHMRIRELLLDILDTEATTADHLAAAEY